MTLVSRTSFSFHKQFFPSLEVSGIKINLSCNHGVGFLINFVSSYLTFYRQHKKLLFFICKYTTNNSIFVL